MTHVATETCSHCKYTDCVEVGPVNAAIADRQRMRDGTAKP